MSRNVRTTIMMNEDLFSAMKVLIALTGKKETISSFINKAIYEKIQKEISDKEGMEFILSNVFPEDIYNDNLEDF